MSTIYSSNHVVLTSHPGHIFGDSPSVNWGATDPHERGPIIASMTNLKHRNAIGTHSGSYAVYRALAFAAGQMSERHRPDLTDTAPVTAIKPNPSWFLPNRIVTLDPWGAKVDEVFGEHLEKGYDIRPSIAVTKGHIDMPEISHFVRDGLIKRDGKVVSEKGDVAITKAAVEPVWYLPGIAERIGVEEGVLRKMLFKQTGGMFPELVTRPDLKVMLPPIGSITAYIFGDPDDLSDPSKAVTCRVHDECNGSDVFGSDICTCRPYLVHGVEEAVKTAQGGGVGLIVYFRKEGRALGEVTKFLVYNARKRQEGGDSAANYFARTECVAGVEDMRFQEFMPDILNWLGVQRIDNLISMSDMKYDAIVNSGIEVVQRVAIPDERIPADALVEMEAKKAAGYFTEGEVKDDAGLEEIKGRAFND